MLTINELRQFSGTEYWYKHLSGYLYTDGVLYVAQEGGAFWLIDKILFTTRAKNSLQEFGAWKFEVNEDKSAILVCEDGNYHELYREKIEWTDFPLNCLNSFIVNILNPPYLCRKNSSSCNRYCFRWCISHTRALCL